MPEEILLLTSHSKNISVFECNTREYLYELNIDKKEMSCARQQGRRLFVGTFVDTIFIFIYDVKSRKLVQASQMCTHDSIVSIGISVEGLVMCGQANGFVDLLTYQVRKSNKGEYKMDNVSHIHNSKFGYVNCIIQATKPVKKNLKQTTAPEEEGLEFALGTEFGLFFIDLNGIEMTVQADIFFKGQQVS